MQSHQPTLRRIVLYEYTCSGGLLGDTEPCDSSSLSREGWAMLPVLASDLAAIPDICVQVLADHRGLPGPLPNCELIAVQNPTDERALLTQLAAGADWTIVIAPETDRALLDRGQWVEACAGRLLGPASSLIGLLGDKHRTAEHLCAFGIPCPSGTDWRPGDSTIRRSTPIVVKPVDGAGSQDTYLLNDQAALDELLANLANRPEQKLSWRIEAFAPGVAVSVSALCGPAGNYLLPPCYQRLDFDGTIAYQGGAYPVQPVLAERASILARRAVETLPEPIGYIGIDMVLGDDGRDDCVIEINPRLTTSYVGLRAAARTNLAKALLDVAEGNQPDLSFDDAPLEFDADGTIRRP